MTMNLKTVLGGSLLVAAFAALPAMAEVDGKQCPAQGRQAGVLANFDQIDTDGNGELSQAEIEAFVEARAVAAEDGQRPGRRGDGLREGRRGRRGRDGAGMERMLGRAGRLGKDGSVKEFSVERFEKIDVNADGVIDATEWETMAVEVQSRMRGRFARMAPMADLNEDGTLDDEEIAAMKAERLERMQDRLLDRHPEADLDGDGVISEAELEAFHETRVAERRARLLENHPEADTDGDGAISDAEAKAFFKTHRRPGGPRRGHGPGPIGGTESTDE